MKELIQEFLDYISKEKNYSQNTVISYRTDLTDLCRHLEKTMGEKFSIKDVTRNEIRPYLRELLMNKLSKKT